MRPYDYARRNGIHEISWTDFGELTDQLAEMLERERVDLILGVARAGLFPATAVAMALRRDFHPVRLSRRVDDEVVHASPQWSVPVPEAVQGRTVAVVDEIADTGETLSMVHAAALERGAHHVVTAALVAHPWAEPLPRHVPVVTDAFVVFPWGRQVLINGEWQPHPEMIAAMEAQEAAQELDS